MKSLCVMLLTLAATATILAQTTREKETSGSQIVERVIIRGNRRFLESEIKSWVSTRKRSIYNPQMLDRDVRALYNTGHFADVKVYVEGGLRGGKIVTFEVMDKPVISDIHYEGIDSSEQAEVLEEWRRKGVDLFKGALYDPVIIRRAAKVMQDLISRKKDQNVKASPYVERQTVSEVLVAFKVDGRPCGSDTIVIEEQADAPGRLSVQSATCGDFFSNVDLLLENLSTKQIRAYEISQTKDYENIKNVKSSEIRTGIEIKPGESSKINFNGGFLEGYSYGKPVGLFKRDTYKISWVEFSDDSQWGQVPRSIQEKPTGHDLTLRDDKEPFIAAFQFKDKALSIMSCGEYGFGGPGLKLETNGCTMRLTFDFLWRQDFSYHPRKKPDEIITIKAGDHLHGEFTFDSCTKTAKGVIRNDNQNLTLMVLSDTDTSGKRGYCSGPPDYK